MTNSLTEHIQSNIYLLYFGIILVFIALSYYQLSGKSRVSLVLISFSSIALSMFVCLSDPFLHMWDEQVHAVVAKNMMSNPFKPMLMSDPVLPYNFKNWTGNHIWLHKQPLFLWQIALSFKIFGVNIFSLRLPSMIMLALMVFPVYRIGKIIWSKQTGIYAAILLTGSNFFYQLVSGRIHTDHNDIAFLFYVTLSIWAWFEKDNSDKKYWIVLIGLFSGAAILNKWLVGLLVYSVWGLNILLIKENRIKIKSYLEIALSVLITTVIALPWQLFILNKFPKESKFEFEFNSLHFFEALENHSGNFFYHLNKIGTLYGDNFQYVLIASLIILLFSRVKGKYKFALITWVLIVYAFYSAAATKMPAFTIIVAPIIYIIVAQAITNLYLWMGEVKYKYQSKTIFLKLISITLVFLVFLYFLNHDKLCLKNSEWEQNIYQKAIITTQEYKKLPEIFGDNDIMVYNSKNHDKLKIMFHTDYRARSGVPSIKTIEILNENNIKLIVFDDNKLPDYILTDNSIAKIKSRVWQKDFKGDMVVYY